MQHCDNPFKALLSSHKDERLQAAKKIIVIILFFQNHTTGLQFVSGLELEYICQNSNTLYYIYVLLFFATEARTPGDVISDS